MTTEEAATIIEQILRQLEQCLAHLAKIEKQQGI